MRISTKNAEWTHCRVCGHWEEMWLHDHRICPICQGALCAMGCTSDHKDKEFFIKKLREDPEWKASTDRIRKETEQIFKR